MQASNKINSELRAELEIIKTELQTLQKRSQRDTNALHKEIMKKLNSLIYQKEYLNLCCRNYMKMLAQLTPKTYRLPELSATQKFKRACWAIVFTHRLKSASNRSHFQGDYKAFHHSTLTRLPADLRFLMKNIFHCFSGTMSAQKELDTIKRRVER